MRHFLLPLTLLCLVAMRVSHSQEYIRVNQLGYLPDAVKAAVFASIDPDARVESFELHDALTDEVIYRFSTIRSYGAYGAFAATARLDFSAFSIPGAYYITAGDARSPSFRIDDDVYDGAADFLLRYMRQQRCGYNPFLRDSCHTHDGFIIYHPTLDSTYIDVHGGWHDASDYLQYVTTSANAVYQMLFAYQMNPGAFRDEYDAAGLPGANGVADILDEAKWGLEWLDRMNPSDGMMFNQIADDRDHLGFRLPTEDTISYGKGLERPVYFCTGEPQGALTHKNRATGIASTAGKYASAFSLGSLLLQDIDPEFSARIRRKAIDAYRHGQNHPGVCQTAPCRAPYFYEEEDWADDMELAAAQLYRLTGEDEFLADAAGFGRQQTVKPWMGADTARHYEWYPFVNLGHYQLGRSDNPSVSGEFTEAFRLGIDRLRARGARNAFLFGIPFIWCSNNLVSAALTNLRLYSQLTEDQRYAPMEASLRDWLFGCNPWGTSMIVGLPEYGVSPRDPHSAFSHLYQYRIDGGLVDGPVYGSIFNGLIGLTLHEEDEFAEFQSDLAVYHDDYGDYSTNEPTMDGTASLTYYLSSLEMEGRKKSPPGRSLMSHGGIIRMDTARQVVYLVFTGHEFADGGTAILSTLRAHDIKASFFFTGDFYRMEEFAPLIRRIRRDGHYLGAHSDRHLLYASWEKRDSLLVIHEEFLNDLRDNYAELRKFGVAKQEARFFMPPYEWYNDQVSDWCKQAGLKLVNFTPGSYSNADWTYPELGNPYLSSEEILRRVLRYEEEDPNGMNGFILLTHIGADPRRPDPFHERLDELITELENRGYEFARFPN